jgi:hypothetical protein
MIGVRLSLCTVVIASSLTLLSDTLPDFLARTIPSADSETLDKLRRLVRDSQPLVISLDFMVLLTRQDPVVHLQQLPVPWATKWNCLLRDLTGRQDMCLADFCREQQAEAGLGVDETREEGGLMEMGKSEATSLSIWSLFM